MKQICFLVYDYSQSGGAERMTTNLTNELSCEYEISIVSVFKFFSKESYSYANNISLSYIFKSEGSILKSLPTITRYMRRYLKNNRIDYLVCVDVTTALMGVLSTAGNKTKLFVWDHSSAFNKDLYSKLNLRIYSWFGLWFSDNYITLTEQSKKEYLRIHRIKEDKVKVIPNWIDAEVCKSNIYCFENKKIITVGRADTVKGFEKLIEVAKKVLKANPEWEWHIWGNFDSEYGKNILDIIRNSDVADRLIYKGISSNIYEIYQNYSFYVLTSLYEGLPMTLLEAQMNRLPVVAFNCMTGPGEMIEDNVNGYLINCWDIDEMTSKICYLINNKDVADAFSIKSRINMNKFEKNEVIRLWRELFI